MASNIFQTNTVGTITVTSVTDPSTRVSANATVDPLPAGITAEQKAALLAVVNARIAQINTLTTQVDNQKSHAAKIRNNTAYSSATATLDAAAKLNAVSQIPKSLSTIIPRVSSMVDAAPALQRIYVYDLANLNISIGVLTKKYHDLLNSLTKLQTLQTELMR